MGKIYSERTIKRLRRLESEGLLCQTSPLCLREAKYELLLMPTDGVGGVTTLRQCEKHLGELYLTQKFHGRMFQNANVIDIKPISKKEDTR